MCSSDLSITDTLGAGLLLLGLALLAGPGLVTVKLVMILLFVYVTSPTAGHALAKAAYASGLRAETGEGSADDASA